MKKESIGETLHSLEGINHFFRADCTLCTTCTPVEAVGITSHHADKTLFFFCAEGFIFFFEKNSYTHVCCPIVVFLIEVLGYSSAFLVLYISTMFPKAFFETASSLSNVIYPASFAADSIDDSPWRTTELSFNNKRTFREFDTLGFPNVRACRATMTRLGAITFSFLKRDSTTYNQNKSKIFKKSIAADTKSGLLNILTGYLN